MKNCDFLEHVDAGCSPTDVFGMITEAVSQMEALTSPIQLNFAVEMMREVSYSDALTCRVFEAAKTSAELILSDPDLSKNIVPWRYYECGYLSDMARHSSDIIQSCLKSSIGMDSNNHTTTIDVFNSARNPQTKNMLHAQYTPLRHSVIRNKDEQIVGFNIHEILRLNKNHHGLVLRPFKWLSGLFHEHVHGLEHQLELAYENHSCLATPLSACISDQDLEITNARHQLKIDNKVAYNLYRVTPSERLALSAQEIFQSTLKKGLMKLVK